MVEKPVDERFDAVDAGAMRAPRCLARVDAQTVEHLARSGERMDEREVGLRIGEGGGALAHAEAHRDAPRHERARLGGFCAQGAQANVRRRIRFGS